MEEIMEIQDIITQLNKEKNLLKEEINEKENRINEIDVTIQNLFKIVNSTEIMCPDCNGGGRKFHRSCAEDEGDWTICKKCQGEGRVKIYIKK
jgi:chromosome segregation ATPase